MIISVSQTYVCPWRQIIYNSGDEYRQEGPWAFLLVAPTNSRITSAGKLLQRLCMRLFSGFVQLCMQCRLDFLFLLGATVPVFCYSCSFASCSVLIFSIPDISLPALLYSPNVFPSYVLRHVDSVDPASALNTSGLN